MPGPYGVVPTGFNRKPLVEITTDIEAEAVNTFGPDVILDPESPMGQLIGLFSYLTTILWELGEDVYSANDPDQAEDVNLDRLAKIRLLARSIDELDPAFRGRITNAQRSDIALHDIAGAVAAITGVTYVRVFSNDGNEVDDNGLPAHSVAVAVLGGTDEEVAAEVRRFVVPGVGTWGNAKVETILEGYCRTVHIIRPVVVPLTLEIEVRSVETYYACEPPAAATIRDEIFANLTTGNSVPGNGEDITIHRLRTAVSSMPNVEIVSASASAGGTQQPLPWALDLFEIAQFVSSAAITVRYAA